MITISGVDESDDSPETEIGVEAGIINAFIEDGAIEDGPIEDGAALEELVVDAGGAPLVIHCRMKAMVALDKYGPPNGICAPTAACPSSFCMM